MYLSFDIESKHICTIEIASSASTEFPSGYRYSGERRGMEAFMVHIWCYPPAMHTYHT